MAQETEIKLILPPSDLDTIAGLPFIKTAEKTGEYELLNRYFDTPDLALTHYKIALRIRQAGQYFIQTLKTQGVSSQGLHQRKEWEWPLSEDALDPSRLYEAEWPTDLSINDLGTRLEKIFSTDFNRTVWMVNLSSGEIEVALDVGCVSVEGPDGELLTDPICELELELKKGDVDWLLSVADEMRKAMPALEPSDISKAQRGYQLYEQAKKYHTL